MLEPQQYRANEQLAKSAIPSWRIARIHNLDLFERVGFPVRISTIRELGQIIDTMQENRFDRYMAELGGLSDDEFGLFLEACKDSVRFQLTYLPHRPAVLPLSTLMSALAIYKKIKGAKPDVESILEIGPGCGYVSFFLRHHARLTNYSQIESCESFYILQNLVNVFCFGPRQDERALISNAGSAADYFTNPRGDFEVPPPVRATGLSPICFHYPWWRIGELARREASFDVVTSNANLLEFSALALDDYLTLLHRVMKPDGVFFVQCTGFDANGTVPELLDKLYAKGFAPLMFVKESDPTSFPDEGLGRFLKKAITNKISFTNNNAVFVKSGHPLFEKYNDYKNYHFQFVAPEPIVRSMFFERPSQRRSYTIEQVTAATEDGLAK